MRALLKKIFLKFGFGKFMVSGGYKLISREQARVLSSAEQWQDPSLPAKQWKIVEQELAQIKATQKFPSHMQVLIDLIKETNLSAGNILEIGCSSGYYAEILKLAGINLDFSGCDYSESFIALARKLYPNNDFKICSATALPYPDNFFTLSVSGCCILHILDYSQALKEAVRVCDQYMLLSRTPVFENTSTTYTQKIGYGIKMMEIIFNEQEIIDICKENGAELVAQKIISTGLEISGVSEAVKVKTYLFKKIIANV